MAKKKAARKVKSGLSDDGVYFETSTTTKVRKITNIRCDGCSRDDSLKIGSRQKSGNHYMRCMHCGQQPMLKEAKKAFKRKPEVEILEAAGRNSHFTYRRDSRNPYHHLTYEGYRNRCALAAERVAAEIKRLKKALVFFTEGAGCYDGWSVEQLMKEFDAHGH